MRVLELPPEMQELADEAIAALGGSPMLDRHPAFDQLTSWLELEDHLVDVVSCQEYWFVGNGSQVDLCLLDDREPTPTSVAERIAYIRRYLQLVFDRDPMLVDEEAAVHIAIPVRSSAGKLAILGFLFAAGGFKSDQPFTTEGLFATVADYQRWLLEEVGLYTCMEQFDRLSSEEQLSFWPAPRARR